MTVESIGSVGKHAFENRKCLGNDALEHRKVTATQYYTDLRRMFHMPKPDRGAEVIRQLQHIHKAVSNASRFLEDKFKEVSDCDNSGLNSLERNLAVAQITRNTEFTIFSVLSTGGTGAVGTLSMGARALIIGSTIILKSGTKVYDVFATTTDEKERQKMYAGVVFSTAMDVIISGTGPSASILGKAGELSGLGKHVLAASLESPAEGVKTYLVGGTWRQNAFATAFQACAPLNEGLGKHSARISCRVGDRLGRRVGLSVASCQVKQETLPKRLGHAQPRGTERTRQLAAPHKFIRRRVFSHSRHRFD